MHVRRRLSALAAPLMVGFIVITSLFMRRDQLAQPVSRNDAVNKNPPKPIVDGAILSATDITQYLDAILTSQPSTLPNLRCPALNSTTRYNVLKNKGSGIQYFFALNLRQNLPLLPRLIGSIVEAIHFLGPAQCALSIVEGNSPDGTADVLSALRPALENMGVAYYFESSTIDPSKDDRIGRLAQLRNMALAPLSDLHDKVTSSTTVIFLNDVSACPEDILELVYQKMALGADMTCAMDWTYVSKHPTFYDVWISRTINGDSFFEIPPDGNWDSAWNLFWNADDDTRDRFSRQRPFQVFACWNGATAFTAQPLLEGTVQFRAANESAGECRQGEPQLFCKDLWFNGYRKIAVVPSVNLEYSVEKGEMIKASKGYTSDLVSNQDPADDQIDWRLDPPDMVRCIASWANQFWQSWDETLKS